MLKNDIAYTDHILKCIKKIRKFVKGVDKKEFSKNELLQDAVIRNFEVIGEASKKISTDFKKIYEEVGRSVVKKIFWIVGAGSLFLLMWLGGNGHLPK